jgi:hypothetical protein
MLIRRSGATRDSEMMPRNMSMNTMRTPQAAAIVSMFAATMLRAALILFTERLDVRFAVRIEEFLTALLPRGFEFGSCDVPVRPAFLADGT